MPSLVVFLFEPVLLRFTDIGYRQPEVPQMAEMPPVTERVWPVIRAAPGPARKTAASAMSSAWTTPRWARVLALANSRPANESPIRLSCSSVPSTMEGVRRSEEHTSELQSLMRISYAVFCLKKKIHQQLKYPKYYVESNHTNNHYMTNIQ